MATELEELIVFYENKLFYDRHIMPPSVQYLTELTVKKLKELKELQKGD